MTRKYALLTTALAVALVAGAVGIAAALDPPVSPYAANLDCLTCHAAAEPVPWSTMPVTDFSVAPVDFTTACWKCHWEDTSHPLHNRGGVCGSCHSGMGASAPSALPNVETSAGWFNSADSLSTDVVQLHAVHLNPRWAGTLVWAGRQCKSCHARAACTACHTGGAEHGEHGYAVQPGTGVLQPWSGVTASGTPAGDEYASTAMEQTVSCDVSGCHPVSRANLPTYKDRRLWELNPATYASYGPVTITGTGWRMASAVQYIGGTYDYVATAGATVETVFRGESVKVLGPKNTQWGGIVDVYLDEAKVGTYNGYAPSSVFSTTLWSAEGLDDSMDHTLRLVHTGTRQSPASTSYMAVDAFEVFRSNGPYAGPCTDCHEEMVREHTP